MGNIKYKIHLTKEYVKSYQALRPKERQLVNEVVEILAKGDALPDRYKDHPLEYDFEGFRDCHIKDDLVLVYKIEDDVCVLTLLNVGKHAKVFKKRY